MQPRNKRIFISYRRSTSAPWAGRLFDALRQIIPPDRIFLDVSSIPLGADFNKSIDNFLSSCAVTLVLIDRDWIDARDHRGGRRLELADDPVRKEISSALRSSTWTIPVLIDGAPMPRADQLPQDIAHLVKRHAFSLSHDSFYRDFDYLRHALWEFLGDIAFDHPAGEQPPSKSSHPKIISTVPSSNVNMAPAPPQYYVPTQQASAEAKRQLLAWSRDATSRILILLGQGGIGKSTLAQAVCHDKDISSSFSDGIYWVSVGPSSKLDVAIKSSCNALFPKLSQAGSAQTFLSLFASQLQNKRALLILDDVWDQDIGASFNLLRTSVNVLITTRLESVGQRLGVRPIRVETMGQAEAITLLERASISETLLQPGPSNLLVNLLDRLPLAILIAARLVTDNTTLRALTTRLAAEVDRLSLLEKTVDPKSEDPARRYRSVYASINVSLDQLSPTARAKFAELAVVRIGQSISVACAATIWGCDTFAAQHQLIDLSYVSLLKRQYNIGADTVYDMHHLIHNRARTLLNVDAVGSRAHTKRRLSVWWRRPKRPSAEGYIVAQRRLLERLRLRLQEGKWSTLRQDPYFVRNLFWHFREAQANADILSSLREELIDQQSRSVMPARLRALEQIDAPHQYAADVEIAWELARVQLGSSRTPNALADAMLCKNF